MHRPLETHHTLRISLQNPITHKEINKLTQRISAATGQSRLLIDFGEHEFASIAVLRYCKNELHRMADKLEQFDKISFIVPKPFQGVNQEQLRYFQEEVEAQKWFKED
ncbi:MAG: hypothetical protein KTR30_05760 [Saprospiraceae bacterium]|nr:hypothetical protein [Saprospiraceae bacterium]